MSNILPRPAPGPAPDGTHPSVSQAEKDARPPAGGGGGPPTSQPPPAPAPGTKLRSCVICRRRKVRCDKLSPCTNCRRANIACVVPSPNDRPPRWARRLERLPEQVHVGADGSTRQQPDAGVSQVMDRLRTLESLVEELNGQLEQARAAAGSTTRSSSSNGNSPGAYPDSTTSGLARLEKPFGRMMLEDKTLNNRYVSSGFWSRISDELDGLKMDARELGGDDSDSSDEDDSPGRTTSTYESSRTPSDRHAMLFGFNNTGAVNADLSEFRPLPSHVPFLLDVFSENVNFMLQGVHMPSVMTLSRNMRHSDPSTLDPVDEALMFSIYYTAVTSMEEDDVLLNFHGATKADLNLKFRLGLEHALAKADFLNSPQLKLVQALGLFLYVARRHDNPRFVWMMTGLAIRMAQAIGLHRDGSHFPHMKPFEAEIRRKTWWMLCTLDICTSEDQGMELTIAHGSFDTKLPLDVNDDDLYPEMTELPPERDGVTDMSGPLGVLEQCILTRKMVSPEVRGSADPLQEQTRLLDTMYDKMTQKFLKLGGRPNILVWVGMTATRLVVSKMTLFVYLPALFSPSNQGVSDAIRNRLLAAAIEVAEYNHALNDEPSCRQWRWVYQSYTHWNAIVYMLLELCRRPWTPIAERMWLALHSPWLIPADPNMDKGARIWIPLRKLTAKARKHRANELERLRQDPVAVAALDTADADIPTPSSPLPFPGESSEELFRQHWRSLVVPQGQDVGTQQQQGATLFSVPDSTTTPELASQPGSSSALSEPTPRQQQQQQQQQPSGVNSAPFAPGPSLYHQAFPLEGTAQWPVNQGPSYDMGSAPWLWDSDDMNLDAFNDVDLTVDLDQSIDWNSWLESATGVDKGGAGQEAPMGYM